MRCRSVALALDHASLAQSNCRPLFLPLINLFSPQTPQHPLFQSLPKTPHIGLRGRAKSLHAAPGATAAPPPSTGTPSTSPVHRIPSPAAASPSSDADAADLESPRLGQAIASRSKGRRQSRKQAGGTPRHSRPRSPKPSRATVLGSTHAHSILHTCLIQGPPSPDNALPLPSGSISLPLPSGSQRSCSPFRGFELPCMTTNEMQVCCGVEERTSLSPPLLCSSV